MKTLIMRITVIMSSLIVIALPFSTVSAQSPVQSRTISVSGEAQVNVVPDEVVITLGVETNDKVLKVAKQQNDDRITKIIAQAGEFDVKPEKVKTDYFSVEPRYKSDYENHEFLGYWVRKNVVVTLSDISKFEGLMGAFLDSGANYVLGVDFRTTELRKYRDQARALAIRAAKEKAEALAGELGQKIGKPLTISEEPIGYWSYYSYWGHSWGGNNNANISQNVIQNAPSDSGAAPGDDSTIAPGQISVTARVNVTFELAD